MTIHLHLGAHKTASTHLQAVLRRNMARLAARGVAVATPDEMRALADAGRRAAARMAPAPSLRAATAARRLGKLAEGAERFIASDENSLGPCAEIVATGRLYPHARARLSVLARLIRPGETTVYLSVRGYPRFLAGVYAQSLRNAPWRPLTEEGRRALAALPRRWPEVVEDIARAAPGAEIVVWRYEDYEALGPAILARLTGGAAPLDGVARRPMETPGAAAMAMIAAVGAREGAVSRGAYDRAVEARPAGPGEPPFDPWTADEARRMEDLYAEDQEALARRLGAGFVRA